MCCVVHFVLVVPAAGSAFVPGVVHIGRIDVVQGLRCVVRFDYPDRGPVLDQDPDQALADGLITQAQADALKQRSGSVWGRELGHFGLLGADTIDMEALLAKALDISTADLQAARVKAQDAALAAAVEAGNITQEQADQMKAQQALQNYFQTQGLQDKIRSLYEDAVNAAVKAGVITQAQADQILSNQSFGFGMRGLGGPDFGMHGFGGRGHGRGGFDGQWFGAPSSGSSSTAPSTTTTPSFFRF